MLKIVHIFGLSNRAYPENCSKAINVDKYKISDHNMAGFVFLFSKQF